jgi:glutathione S-transferase
MALTLYQFEISPFCDKIRRVLNVKGLDYTIREVKLMEAGRLKQVSPSGKFPVLDYHGRMIPDSTTIAHYLEHAHPNPPLVPADPREAALCHILEDWADESLYFIEMTMRLAWPNNAKRWLPELVKHESGIGKRLGMALAPAAVRSQSRAQGIGRKHKDAVVADVERHFGALDALLQDREYLAGNALSLADISVYAQAACIKETEEGAVSIARFPAVLRWFHRIGDQTASRGAAKPA